LLVRLNNRKFRKLDTTRAKLFETLEKSVLKPLPKDPFTFAAWKKARVNIDYHIEINRHYYSVPYQYVHETVEARISEKTVEIFLKGNRIATHARNDTVGKHSTVAEHRPKKHQDLEWTVARISAKGRAACKRALVMNACSYRSIQSILKTGLDRQKLDAPEIPAIHKENHVNVRGASYYGKEAIG
jgi:transposase